MALRIGKKDKGVTDVPAIPAQPGIPDALLEDTPKRKGINPLFIVLGVVVVGAGAAGGYMMFGGEKIEEEEIAPITERRPLPGDGSSKMGAPGKQAAPANPAAPAGAKPANAAAPAKPVVAAAPKPDPKLKELWDKGAAAKHRNDYGAARAAWSELLKIKPGHPGIQDAIDQLPKR